MYDKKKSFVLNCINTIFLVLISVLRKMKTNIHCRISLCHTKLLYDISLTSVSSQLKHLALFNCYYYGRHIIISAVNPENLQCFLAMGGIRKADPV